MGHPSHSRPWENESPHMNAAIPERRPATEEISGVIERVTVHNDESGFCVLRVKTRGRARRAALAALPNRATLLRSSGVSRLMFSFLRSALVAALLLHSVRLMSDEDAKAPAINPQLAAADQ